VIFAKLPLSMIALACASPVFAQSTSGNPPSTTPPPPGPVDTCKPFDKTDPKIKIDGTKFGLITIKKRTTASIAMNKGPVSCIEVPPCSTDPITQPKTEWNAGQTEMSVEVTTTKTQSRDFTQYVLDSFLKLIGVRLKKQEYDTTVKDTKKATSKWEAGSLPCDMAVKSFFYLTETTIFETGTDMSNPKPNDARYSRTDVSYELSEGSRVEFNTKRWSWDGCNWTYSPPPPPPPGCEENTGGGLTQQFCIRLEPCPL
jgi:hypothetical protein